MILSIFFKISLIFFSIQSISSLVDSPDVFKNRNFSVELVESLKNALDNRELVDIELVSGSDNKR